MLASDPCLELHPQGDLLLTLCLSNWFICEGGQGRQS